MKEPGKGKTRAYCIYVNIKCPHSSKLPFTEEHSPHPPVLKLSN
jgi:hypothetical protein